MWVVISTDEVIALVGNELEGVPGESSGLLPLAWPAGRGNVCLVGVRSSHDIDVLVSFEKWGVPHRWIVDCKLRAKPIEKSYVETLKAIANEVGASIAFLIAERDSRLARTMLLAIPT